MVRKSPTQSTTLYKKPTTIKSKKKPSKKQSNKSIKKITKKLEIETKKMKITKLGRLFINFIKDEKLFPNSPKEVEALNEDFAKLWKILKKNKFIGITPKTKYVDEKYYLGGRPNFVYLVNIVFEIAGEDKYYGESAKLTEEGRKIMIKLLKKIGFIE